MAFFFFLFPTEPFDIQEAFRAFPTFILGIFLPKKEEILSATSAAINFEYSLNSAILKNTFGINLDYYEHIVCLEQRGGFSFLVYEGNQGQNKKIGLNLKKSFVLRNV